MPYIFLGILFLTTSMAQHPEQPYKLEDEDFRNSSFVFKITDKNESMEIILEKNFEGNHLLKSIEDTEIDQIKKISSKRAKKIETDFSFNFLKSYHESTKQQIACKTIYNLQLKNQNLNICDDEEEKIKWVKLTLSNLKDLLKN